MMITLILISKNWNKEKKLSTNETIYNSIENKQIVTLVRKIKIELLNENLESFRQIKVDFSDVLIIFFGIWWAPIFYISKTRLFCIYK